MKKPKTKKQKVIKVLRQRGLLIAVVLLVAAGGTYMIVSSSAMTDSPGYRSYERKINRAPAGSRARIVYLAKQQLGYAEKPVNRVKYFDWAGDQPNAPGPWCSVFATWVWHAAGVQLNGAPYPKQPGVAQVRDAGMRDGRFHKYNPQPGDAILYGRKGSSHIGIVTSVSPRSVSVIEGNASLKGGADKHVIKRTFNFQHPKRVPHGVIYGYVSPPGT